MEGYAIILLIRFIMENLHNGDRHLNRTINTQHLPCDHYVKNKQAYHQIITQYSIFYKICHEKIRKYDETIIWLSRVLCLACQYLHTMQ